MASDKVFCKGVMTFKPKEGTPSFVKASVMITIDDLIEWSKGDGAKHLTDYNGKKQVKLQITENKKDGKYMIAVDTWKKKDDTVEEEPVKEEHSVAYIDPAYDDDLPF